MSGIRALDAGAMAGAKPGVAKEKPTPDFKIKNDKNIRVRTREREGQKRVIAALRAREEMLAEKGVFDGSAKLGSNPLAISSMHGTIVAKACQMNPGTKLHDLINFRRFSPEFNTVFRHFPAKS